METVTKTYKEIPFAHRAWRHQGHCRDIHGHNWTVTFIFECSKKDSCGFVVDLGKLGELKSQVNEFDHALVLNTDDPELEAIRSLGVARIIEVPSCSCEGLARYFYEMANELVAFMENGRVWVSMVIVAEDGKNKATYSPTRK